METLRNHPKLVYAGIGVLAAAKLIYYYSLMGVTTGFIPAVVITFLILAAIFCIFKRKWIFGIIYTVLSILMVIDVNYFSFFNRNLSITQLGAADLLGGVTESIKELFMPLSLLLLADAILLIVLPLILDNGVSLPRRIRKRKSEDYAETIQAAIQRAGDSYSSSEENVDAIIDTGETEKATSAQVSDLGPDTPYGRAKTITEVPYTDLDEDGLYEELHAHSSERSERKLALKLAAGESEKGHKHLNFKSLGTKEGIENTLKFRLISLGLAVVFIGAAVLIMPENNSYAASVLSQEYFSYHIRDIAGINQIDMTPDYEGLIEAGGTYEKEIKGDDFGVAEGMNVIVIQVEAMQNFVIGREYNGQEITPFINSLLEEDTYYFDTYYQQTGSGNTSDAEFASNNSLYGTRLSYTYQLYEDNYWRGLPELLKEDGYSTSAFHAYDGDYWNRENIYPGMGFEKFHSKTDYDLNEIVGMGLSDEEFFTQSMKYIGEQKEPFYSFLVTLSSHYPFYVGKAVDIKLDEKDQATLFGHYLEAMNYYDHCLEVFFDKLKDEGLYDDTVVVFYGDHLGMNPKTEDVQKRMTEFLGRNYDYEDAMNIPLVIHVPGSGEHETISTAGGQTDLLPTLWYLLGYDELDTVYFGHNLLTARNNFVPLKSYLPEGSFVYGDCIFKMSKSGLTSEAEIINLRTHEEASLEDRDKLYARSVQLQNTSEYYLEKDVLKLIYEEGDTLKEIIEAEDQGGFYSEVEYQHKIVDASKGEGDTDGLYCIENLDKLYKEGERAFALNLVWTSDMHVIALHNADELGEFFTKPARIGDYEDLLMEQTYGHVTPGLTIITGSNLVKWMKAHKDTYFYLALDSDQIVGDLDILDEGDKEEAPSIPRKHFTRAMQANNPDEFARIIMVAKDKDTLVEYNTEQLHNVIFENDGSYTEEEVIDMVGQFGIYGAAMDIRNVQHLIDVWVFDDVAIYGIANERSKRLMDSVRVDGVFVFDTGSGRTERFADK